MWIYVDFQHVANMIIEEMESVCVLFQMVFHFSLALVNLY